MMTGKFLKKPEFIKTGFERQSALHYYPFSKFGAVRFIRAISFIISCL